MPTMTIAKREEKAVNTGIRDGFLTALFAGGSLLVVELLTWALGALPLLDDFKGGQYAWLKVPLVIIITAILKGIDRKRHEDPSASTGLIKLPE